PAVGQNRGVLEPGPNSVAAVNPALIDPSADTMRSRPGPVDADALLGLEVRPRRSRPRASSDMAHRSPARWPVRRVARPVLSRCPQTASAPRHPGAKLVLAEAPVHPARRRDLHRGVALGLRQADAGRPGRPGKVSPVCAILLWDASRAAAGPPAASFVLWRSRSPRRHTRLNRRTQDTPLARMRRGRQSVFLGTPCSAAEANAACM